MSIAFELSHPSSVEPDAMPGAGNKEKRLLWGLLLIAAILFGLRGVYRGVRPHITNDFFSIYSISKAWAAGEAAYSTPIIVETFQASSGYRLGRNTLAQAESYSALPGMMPFAAPFSVLRWRAANSAFVVISVGVLIAMMWMFARASGASQNGVLAFSACCLALGPLHTGLSGSNVTPLLVGLMGISYLLHRRRQWVAAGVLLGVVGCCKPHIAGAMVLLLIVDREWKTLTVAVSTGLASLAVFITRMAIAGVPWWSDFYQRTLRFSIVGDANDFSLANPARYELLNLQVIVASATSSRAVANGIAVGLGVVLVAMWCLAARRHGRSNPLAFATINLILLLPSYHRFNDASVLVFLFAAAFLENSAVWTRRIAIVTALLFTFPVAAALVSLTGSGQIASGLARSTAFQLTLLTVDNWALLGVAATLLAQISCSPRSTPIEIHSPVCVA